MYVDVPGSVSNWRLVIDDDVIFWKEMPLHEVVPSLLKVSKLHVNGAFKGKAVAKKKF